MFEAGVNTDFTVTFYSASKKFRDSIAEIIKNDFRITKSKFANKHGLWSIMISLANPKNHKTLNYFEVKTVKWKRLDGFINGFNYSVKNLNEAKTILDISYPKLRNCTFSDILDCIAKRNEFDTYEIMKELQISRANLQKRLDLLVRCNILMKKRSRRNKYSINPDTNKWRVLNIKSESE